MGLWARLARLFGGGTDRAAREAAERLLLEADFGVAATEEILDKLGRGEVSEQALERIVSNNSAHLPRRSRARRSRPRSCWCLG
jgi:signal recognition particle GTPase